MNTATAPIGGPTTAVATPHPAATAAAAEIVAAGGNAVDAAVAAAAVLTVVYPHMCSVGGDVIAVLHRAGGRVTCVNASGAYGTDPSGVAALRDRDAMPISGPLTVTVPGAISGWANLLRLGGSLGDAEILAPAIRLAAGGVEVSAGLARTIGKDAASLHRDPGMRRMFFRGDDPLPRGAMLRQPGLAATLAELAASGLDSFYRGRTGEVLTAALRRLGVPIAPDDLTRHEASVEEPLAHRLGELTVFTAGPNSQGYLLPRSLGALACAGPIADGDASLLAELFYDGDVHRDAHLADPRFAAFDAREALSPGALDQVYRRSLDRLMGAPRGVTPVGPRPGGDTVGIAVVDADGTAVSVIQSNFHTFGAHMLEPSTGLVLHNRASFFSLDARSPNVLEPGKRPAHTLVPVVVTEDCGRVSAHSTMGGKAQPQIQAQLLLHRLRGADAQEAVSAPRFVVGGLDAQTDNDHILVEPSLPPATTVALSRSSLRQVPGQELDDLAGHSMIASLEPDGALDAGADPRSDGTAATC